MLLELKISSSFIKLQSKIVSAAGTFPTCAVVPSQMSSSTDSLLFRYGNCISWF